MAWMTRSAQARQRQQEEAALCQAAQAASAQRIAVVRALTVLMADGRMRLLLASHGVQGLLGARSARPATNGRVEGVAVLGRVVWSGVVARWLADESLVSQLSRDHPAELAVLREAAERGCHGPA